MFKTAQGQIINHVGQDKQLRDNCRNRQPEFRQDKDG